LSLLFLIPVPGAIRQALAQPLQLFAASFTGEVLGLLGLDIVREGAVLVIRGNPIAVGEACDGMRMVFALALVVFAFVFSVPLRFETRILLLVLSPFIALLCNVLRLIPTAIAYGFVDADRAQQIHDWAGWAMLPAALVMLVGVVKLLQWLELPVYRWRLAGA
jgi:exosortase